MALIRTDSELGADLAFHLVEARILASVELKEQGFKIRESPIRHR